MKKYKVIISDSAIGNIIKIYNYIAFELLSPETALKQYNLIVNSILKLETFPEKYVIDETKYKKIRNVRRMNVSKFVVFFLVDKNVVKIISVLYGGMN